MIRGSINLPAQSLYHTIPALYKLFSAAKVSKVIWFCGEFMNLLPLLIAVSSRNSSDNKSGLIVLQDRPAEEAHALQAGLRII